MLGKLTKEQEAIMLQTRDEWINLFFDNVKSQKGIDRPMFEDGIKWLYNDLLNKPTPKVVYCDSWLSCLLTIAILKDKKHVWASVGDSVRDSIWASVRASVWDSVWDSVGDSVRDSVRDSVWASVGDSVWDLFNEYSSYIDLSNYGWISFYDFFEKINILDNFEFKQYKKIIKSGVFQAYEYENFVFAVQPPISISKDERGRLHSVSEPSVIFRDKSEYYYIHGVNIQYPLFDKLSQNKYSFDDFVSENNEEIKAAALSFIEERHGNEALFRFISSNLKEIDSYTDKKNEGYLVGTTKGMNIGVYTLFKGKIESIDLAFVRCYCPSTDRMFFLAVDPINNNAKDAIASLYRVPRKLLSEIKYIQRQGERFSTVFTEEGKSILKTLSESDISDLTHISGDSYFKLMQYEY